MDLRPYLAFGRCGSVSGMTKTLHVSDGRVSCRIRGDIDVDGCVGCPRLVDLQDEGGREIVLCDGVGRPRVLELLRSRVF